MTSSVNHSSAMTTRELCLAAVMTAVVFLATFVPRIPIPLGYAHLGDAAIFLMVLFLGRRETLIAACFGSALSDLLGGFPLWIVPTIIIKFSWRISPGASSAIPEQLARSDCLQASCSPPSGWPQPTRFLAPCSMTASLPVSLLRPDSSLKAS